MSEKNERSLVDQRASTQQAVYTSEEIKEINRQREKLDSLYYLNRLIKCVEGVNIILESRRAFYEKYGLSLQEFVLWGRYLLNYRGTIQEISQANFCGNPPEITTLSDFMKSSSSIRIKEVKAFPTRNCICAVCHQPITIDDVKSGNFDFQINRFVHKVHKD